MKAKLLGILFSLVLVSISYGSKITGENTNGTVGLLQTTITDNEIMIVAKLSIKPEKIKAFTEAAKEMIEKSSKEAGCKFYQLYQDPYNNTKFVFVEEYKNQAAVDAHFATDYFKAFGPRINDMVSEPGKIKIVTVAKVENK